VECSFKDENLDKWQVRRALKFDEEEKEET
jgi:hypothetical protein